MRPTIAATLLMLAPLFACGEDPTGGDDNPTFDFDFAASPEGWTAAFVDYPQGEEEKHELLADHRPLPAPLDESRRGFLLSGNNQSDDLFMFLKRRVTGLEPETEYDVAFRVEFATNAASGCFGVGGAQGESVVVKAGASDEEPKPVVDAGAVRLNLDKGNQLEGGADAVVLGDIANSSTDCLGAPYELKALESEDAALVATTDDEGGLWVFVGTESGYESTTALYYTRIRATLRAR